MTKEEFQKCLQTLTKTERTILDRYLQGMTQSQIVEQTDYSENVVYKRLANACRKFGFEKPEGGYYKEIRKAVVELFIQYAPEQVNHAAFGYPAPTLSTSSKASQIIYVSRPAFEKAGYEAIHHPGGLLRIKAPTTFGKTMLLSQILTQAQLNGCETISLSFGLAAQSVFKQLETFSKWFCAVVSHDLGRPNQIEESWTDIYASNFNTTRYFENFLLNNRDSPLVLALDDTDLVFDHPEIALDFCKLLRGWYSKARSGRRNLWQNLRIIIVHSTENYGPLDINTSPLANVGMVIDLPEFTKEQVEELARQNGLDWTHAQTVELMKLIGGHPKLAQSAFDHLRRGKTLSKVLQNAHTQAGIYSSHLRDCLANLRKKTTPDLASAFNSVISSAIPIHIEAEATFQLYSMGLIKLEGDLAKPRNELYRKYFQGRL